MIDPEYDILNGIDDAALIINRKYEIIFANQSFLNLQKSISENLVTEKRYAVLHQHAVPCLEPHTLEQLFCTGTPVTREQDHLPGDGRRRTYQISLSPLKNEHGEVVHILQLLKDITLQRCSELALRKSREKWEKTFNSIPDIVLLQDTDLRIVKVNQVGCETFGLSADKIVGKYCYEFFNCILEPCSFCPLLESQKSLRAHSREMYHEKLNKTFLVSAAPVLDEQGGLEYFTNIARDITEQKKMQLESDQRLQQIIQADKLASLGEVVAGVTHEINNPNSFISYNAPLLEEIWQFLQHYIDGHCVASEKTGPAGITVSELCQDMSDIILAIKVGSERITQVVNSLKDFARLDESQQADVVRLNEIIEKTYWVIGAQMRKSAGNVEFHLAGDLPPVTGHFAKLRQVIANIFLNASHAIQERSEGMISITTRVIEHLDAVIVAIEDNGMGMDPQTMDRIFEPFFTTRRNSGGTGLGLSVSYGLVQEHGGCIAVLSRPGIGTRFTVFLPKDVSGDPLALQLEPGIVLVTEEENMESCRGILQEVTGNNIFTLDRQETLIPFLKEHPEVDILLSPIGEACGDSCQILGEVKKQFPLLAVFLYAESGAGQLRNPIPFAPDCLLHYPFNGAQLRDCISSINRIRL